MKKILIILFLTFLCTPVSFATDSISLKYNIIPESKSNSIIDSNFQNKLSFRVYSTQGPIYLNNNEVNIIDKKFQINIDGLSGKQEIKFTNAQNEEAIFTYYISDKNGLVKDYLLENLQTYITTIDGIKIIYTDKDSKKISYVLDIVKKSPHKLKNNLKEIILLPIAHPSKAAGITDYNKVTLYNLSTYTDKEIQRIILHEIAHTWAHNLRENKIIDYSYTDFEKAIKSDNNFVTNYSKNSISEDFADSIAFYLINPDTFFKTFPARANYIANLI